MMRVVELMIFGSLAGSLHLGAFFAWSETQPAGGALGGNGGNAALTLEAAPQAFAALVETWDTPPETELARFAPPKTPTPVQRTPVAMPTDQPIDAPRPPAALPPIPELAAPAIIRRGPQVQPQISVPDQVVLPDQLARPPEHQSAPPPPTQTPLAATRPLEALTLDTTPAQPRTENAIRPKPRPQRVAPKTASQSAPAPRVVAAGSGSSPKAATGRTTHTTGTQASTGQLRRLEAVWGSAIQAKVQRSARSPGISTATVRVLLSVSPSGQLLAVRVAKSSGNDKADAAALRAVKRAKRFKSAPDGLTDPSYTFQVTLRFQ